MENEMIMINDKPKPGLYRIHWKNGAKTLAAIGITDDKNGDRWLALTNWLDKDLQVLPEKAREFIRGMNRARKSYEHTKIFHLFWFCSKFLHI